MIWKFRFEAVLHSLNLGAAAILSWAAHSGDLIDQPTAFEEPSQMQLNHHL